MIYHILYMIKYMIKVENIISDFFPDPEPLLKRKKMMKKRM
jgi:hypothetical protein